MWTRLQRCGPDSNDVDPKTRRPRSIMWRSDLILPKQCSFLFFDISCDCPDESFFQRCVALADVCTHHHHADVATCRLIGRLPRAWGLRASPSSRAQTRTASCRKRSVPFPPPRMLAARTQPLMHERARTIQTALAWSTPWQGQIDRVRRLHTHLLVNACLHACLDASLHTWIELCM